MHLNMILVIIWALHHGRSVGVSRLSNHGCRAQGLGLRLLGLGFIWGMGALSKEFLGPVGGPSQIILT